MINKGVSPVLIRWQPQIWKVYDGKLSPAIDNTALTINEAVAICKNLKQQGIASERIRIIRYHLEQKNTNQEFGVCTVQNFEFWDALPFNLENQDKVYAVSTTHYTFHKYYSSIEQASEYVLTRFNPFYHRKIIPVVEGYRVLGGTYSIYGEAWYYQEALKEKGYPDVTIAIDSAESGLDKEVAIPLVPPFFPALKNIASNATSQIRLVQVGQELDFLRPQPTIAEEYIANLLATDNEVLSASDLILKGQMLLRRQQDISGAQSCCQMVLEKFPATEWAGEARLFLGYLALRNKDNAGALEQWNYIVQGKAPTSFDVQLEAALRIAKLYHRMKEREKSLVAAKEIKQAADRAGNLEIAAYTQLQIAGLVYELEQYWYGQAPKYSREDIIDPFYQKYLVQREITKVIEEYPSASIKIKAIGELMYLETYCLQVGGSYAYSEELLIYNAAPPYVEIDSSV
ncbi:MAG: hypothetical protein QME64_07705, partial [bacterium]|nr:hypothetical protein [bacterium]